jgi:putative transposase
MPDYRRAYHPGATFFFTLVAQHRRPIFHAPANVMLLRAAVREVRLSWPFDAIAGVVLPNHLHYMWALPAGDSDYSKRIGRMKALFTRSLGGVDRDDAPRTGSRLRHRESDVWQRRFWEQVIRDEDDYERHFHYLHYNPVKHGLCTCPHEWQPSSFHHWVERKVYEPNWCCSCSRSTPVPQPYGSALEKTVGE